MTYTTVRKKQPLWRKIYMTNCICAFITVTILSFKIGKVEPKYFDTHLFEAYLIIWCMLSIASIAIWVVFSMIRDIWTDKI